jgi:hypothetical protein
MWRRRLREAVTWAILLSVLAGLGAFVWATYHPDHPLLARAAGWPVVGPLVARFRAYYGVGVEPAGEPAGAGSGVAEENVASAGSDAAGGETADDVEIGVRGPVGGTLAPAQRPGAERVWVSAGQALRAAPRDDAPVLGRSEVFERVEVLQRSGVWVRVGTQAGVGWIEAPEGNEDYPLGSGLVAPKPLPSLQPDDEALAAARDLLGVSQPVGRLGPYDFYTDVADPGRLFWLDRLAAQVEPAYRQRYGLRPVGEAREAVLAFADEQRYRLFQGRERRLQGLPASGHAGSGLVAFFVGDRRPSEVAATLVHELVHMLNRRALGPALPPWLDEGLADDLGGSYVGPAGNLEPERLGGEAVRKPGSVDFFGAMAAVRNLNAANARGENRPRLAELVERDWTEFVRGEDRALNYAQAGLFVRYLQDGEEKTLAPGFHRFLQGVSDGGPAVGEALRRELDRSWEELDEGLAAYVRELVLETAKAVSGGKADRQERGESLESAGAGETGAGG